MFDLFIKAVGWTFTIGIMLMGIYVGLLMLRLILGAVGVMLGSSLGTILLALLLWRWWEKYGRERFKNL